MKTIEFFKYQGTGNDFVMIDDRKEEFPAAEIELIRKMCHRKFGIGADGLILIREHETCDFEMVYFNSDGSQSLCGNGSRCAVNFARYLGIVANSTEFDAIDGKHKATIENGLVRLQMHDVDNVKELGNDFFIDTGSPHYIRFVEDVDQLDVYNEGKTIRYSDGYRERGTNVNFATFGNNNDVTVRTYERGVEDETLSCGTGVTAVALAAVQKGLQTPVNIHTRGGDLQVELTAHKPQSYGEIYLTGPAEMVFKGTYFIK